MDEDFLHPPTPCDDGPEGTWALALFPAVNIRHSHTHINGVFTLFIYFSFYFGHDDGFFPVRLPTLPQTNCLSLSLSLNFSLTIIIIIAGHFRGPFIVMVTLRRRICFVRWRWPSALTWAVLKRLYGLWWTRSDGFTVGKVSPPYCPPTLHSLPLTRKRRRWWGGGERALHSKLHTHYAKIPFDETTERKRKREEQR